MFHQFLFSLFNLMSHLDSQFCFQRISRVLPTISGLQLSTFVLEFFYFFLCLTQSKWKLKMWFSFEIIYLQVDQEKSFMLRLNLLRCKFWKCSQAKQIHLPSTCPRCLLEAQKVLDICLLLANSKKTLKKYSKRRGKDVSFKFSKNSS